MSDSLTAAQLACPRCGVALAGEVVGALGLHRCGACGGVWLDPDTFRAVCEGEVKPRGSLSAHAIADDAESSPRHDRVTYLRCPICDDVMNRVNFARVSGVILDVCRSHGAWFDAGELRAVRAFVRGAGLGRSARRRQHDAQHARPPSVPAGSGAGIDLIAALAGIPDRWDVPSRASTSRRFVRAAILAAMGGALLWGAFGASRLRGSVVMAGGGLLLLLAAARALGEALESRSRRRATEP
jgi:Zn-finger nucleic acid-binding protein